MLGVPPALYARIDVILYARPGFATGVGSITIQESHKFEKH